MILGGSAQSPQQLNLNIGDAPIKQSGVNILSRDGKTVYKPGATGGRMAGAPNILKNIKFGPIALNNFFILY